MNALIHKYGAVSADDKPIQISGKTVEEVGFDKIFTELRKIEELKVVVLDQLCVSDELDDSGLGVKGVQPIDLHDMGLKVET